MSFLETLKSRIRPGDDDDDDDADLSAQDEPERDPGRDRNDVEDAAFQRSATLGDDDDDLTEGMEPESVSASGKQIINGHLIVDGADMGAVDDSSISSINDVLSAANVAPTIHVPDDVFLPEDMDGIKFDGERDGFSKKQVAEFFEKAKASSEYLKKIIESRHDDIYSLAGYAKKLNEQIQDSKMMNEVARASGMAVIAGDDNNQVMELTEENQRLKAQLNAAQSGQGSDQSVHVQDLQDQLSELKDRYSSIQDQLGREQYTNKQLSDELSEMRLKLNTKSEQEHDDIDDLASNITSMDEDNAMPPSKKTGNRPQGKQRRPAPTPTPTSRQRMRPPAQKKTASLHPTPPAQKKKTGQARRQLSLKPSIGQDQQHKETPAKQPARQQQKPKLQLKHTAPAKPAEPESITLEEGEDKYISFE